MDFKLQKTNLNLDQILHYIVQITELKKKKGRTIISIRSRGGFRQARRQAASLAHQEAAQLN